MSVFDNFTRKVTQTAQAAAKKSSELVEVTKLNMSIGTEEGKIGEVCTDIGRMVYAAFARGEDIPEAYKVSCEKIKSYEDNIAAMKKKILELKSAKVCPGCSEELEASIAFCPKCGTKQEIPQPKAEEPVQEAAQEPVQEQAQEPEKTEEQQ